MWSWHDDWLLWLIQEGLYAHPLLTSLVLLALVAGLPRHRVRLWWTVMAPVNALAVLCLIGYGAWTAAPGLAWVMLGSLVYQVIRWLFFPAKGKAKSRWWQRLAIIPLRRIAAGYVELDPRAVYWLDLARAERGLAVHRTAAERRDFITWPQGLGRIRRGVWRGWFWLTERRIQLYAALCRPGTPSQSKLWAQCRAQIAEFYRVPQSELSLTEPDLQSELEAVVDRTAKACLLTWTGRGLADYCGRSNHEQNQAEEVAATLGQRWMLHREALTELLTLREPWLPAEAGLEAAARYSYATWQLRRQFDFLWHPEADDNVDLDFVDLAAESSATDEFLAPDSAPDSDSDSVPDPLGEIVADSEERPAAVAPSELVDVDETDQQLSFIQEALHRKPLTSGGEREADYQESGGAVATASDNELFATTEPLEEPEEEPLVTVSAPAADYSMAEWAPRDRDLLRDLTQGIRLLQAFLDVRDRPPAEEQARLEVLFRKQPERRSAVLLLVTLQTLADKYLIGEMARSRSNASGDALARWQGLVREALDKARTRASARANDGKSLPEEQLAWEFFGSFQLDVQYERKAFLEIRELLVPLPNLSAYQFKLLADAEAQLSIHLAGQPRLQNILRQDAIGHYFQASFPGMWTFEVARYLVDNVTTRAELLDRFAANPLGISGGGTLGVQDVPAATTSGRSRADRRDIAQSLVADRRLRIEVAVRVGKKVKTASIATPFHIGPAAHCNWKLTPDQPTFSLTSRAGRLWLDTEQPSPLLSVNGEGRVRSVQLNPGDAIQVGQTMIQIQSVSIS